MKSIMFVIVSLTTVILTACSPFALVVPTATSTPLPPTPTETPIPATATPEPSPTPTPDPLLFRDDFDGAIQADWQLVRKNDKHWSLTNAPGWLEIKARPGSVGSGDIDNLFLYPAPDGNFELQTRLKFKPDGSFQIAGLLIYESPANFIQFGRAFCASTSCAGDGFYLDATVNGNFNPESFATAAPATDTVYLRLSRNGSTYNAFVSEDGSQWKFIGAHNSGMRPLFVGLVAGQAVGSVPRAAQFDYFMMNALP